MLVPVHRDLDFKSIFHGNVEYNIIAHQLEPSWFARQHVRQLEWSISLKDIWCCFFYHQVYLFFQAIWTQRRFILRQMNWRIYSEPSSDEQNVWRAWIISSLPRCWDMYGVRIPLGIIPEISVQTVDRWSGGQQEWPTRCHMLFLFYQFLWTQKYRAWSSALNSEALHTEDDTRRYQKWLVRCMWIEVKKWKVDKSG